MRVLAPDVANAQPAPDPHRYWSLDMLRGLCALTVFLNHWPLWSTFPAQGPVESAVSQGLGRLYYYFVELTWPRGGQHPALIAFFVLSGFCVHLPFERRMGEAGARPDWRTYFLRRFQRIMPVYWIGVTLGLVVVAAEHWRPTGDALLTLHTAATPLQVLARYGGWCGLWPQEIFAGNYILHTVGAEIVIYAAYPGFFLLAAAGRWRLLFFLAAALHLLLLPLRHVVDPFVLFPSVVAMGLFWYFGALAAHLRVRRAWAPRAGWLVLLWLGFLALQQAPYFTGLGLIKQVVWGLVCTLGILWIVGWELRHDDKRDHAFVRMLRWTGDISYPLYAVHTPVILLTNWALLHYFPVRSYGLQLSLNLLLPLAVTLLVHYGVEKRFYRPRNAA